MLHFTLLLGFPLVSVKAGFCLQSIISHDAGKKLKPLYLVHDNAFSYNDIFVLHYNNLKSVSTHGLFITKRTYLTLNYHKHCAVIQHPHQHMIMKRKIFRLSRINICEQAFRSFVSLQY